MNLNSLNQHVKSSFAGHLLVLLSIASIVILILFVTAAYSITVFEQPKVITFGVDARDYNEMAKELSESILSSTKIKLDESKVLALGPVDTDNLIYRFDPRTLQEKIQTILMNTGRMKISYAVDAISENNAAKARYNIMLLEWEKKNTVNPEDLKTFGELSDVDYLLFGRASALTTTKGSKTEATYTYNWKLGDCSTGLLIWAKEKEISKSGATPSIPEWVTNIREDSPQYLYSVGFSEGAKRKQEGLKNAITDAKEYYQKKFNAEFLKYNGFIHMLPANQIESSSVTGGEFQKKENGTYSTWKMMKVSRKMWEKEKKNRTEAISIWNEVKNKNDKMLLRRIIDRYPLNDQNVFQTEIAILKLADLENADGNPMEASLLYENVINDSTSSIWKERATILESNLVLDDNTTAEYFLRKKYQNKSVGIFSAYEVNRKTTRWSKLESELTTLFSKRRSNVHIVNSTPKLSDIFNASAKDTVDKLLQLTNEFDYLIIIIARGSFNTRINSRNTSYSDSQFVGEIKCLVINKNNIEFEDRYKGVGGWNPLGESMSMDVLALNVMKRWKEKFFTHNLEKKVGTL